MVQDPSGSPLKIKELQSKATPFLFEVDMFTGETEDDLWFLCD